MTKIGDRTTKPQVKDKVLIEGVNKVAETQGSPKIKKTESQPYHGKSGEGGGKIKESQNTRGLRTGNGPRGEGARSGIQGKNVATGVPTWNKPALELGNNILKIGSNRIGRLVASEFVVGIFFADRAGIFRTTNSTKRTKFIRFFG